MHILIPFEGKSSFETKVFEITSISLEHEITKNSKEILGNFYVSGTYKEFELSLNALDFKFTLPFSVEVPDNIEEDTLDFTIDNFTYELEDNILTVKIDYVLDAKQKEIFEKVEESETLERLIEEPIIPENILPKDEPNIITSIKTTEDYLTYHVHVVKENDSLESILALYNTSKEELEKINGSLEIKINDKLLIRLNNE